MSKKVVGYIGSWGIFWLGQVVSYFMNKFDWAFLYLIYNNLMITSMKVQDWAGNETPWTINI